MRVLRFLAAVAVLAAMGITFPSVSQADTAIEAESMSYSSGGAGTWADASASGGTLLGLYGQNAVATHTVWLQASSRIVIRARGQQCLGAPAMRVSVDNAAVGNFTVSANALTEYSVDLSIAEGSHSITITNSAAYSTFLCGRMLVLDKMTVVSTAPTTIPTTPPSDCAVNEYQVSYYNNTALSGSPAVRQCETSVGGNFRSAAPVSGVNTSNWGAQYVGTIHFPVNGNYVFSADTGNMAVRVWLDGQLVIDKGAVSWGRNLAAKDVAAGDHTVQVVFWKTSGDSFEFFSVSQMGPGTASTNGNYYSADSFWNTPIPADAQIDPRSDGWVTMLGNQNGISLNSSTWTQPIYVAPPGTPTRAIRITNSSKYLTVPYLPSYKASPDGDSALIIVDQAKGCAYELEMFNNSSSAVASASYHAYTGTGGHTSGPAHAGGELSWLAGLIRSAEVNAGGINHALRYALPIGSPRFAYPGTRSDGSTPNGIPQGTRMRLDPSLNLDQFGLTPFQQMVAVALQIYGGYNADTAGVLAVATENTAASAPFNVALAGLPQSLMQHLQFLKPTVASTDIRLDEQADQTCAQQQ
ncbi:PA14 domain-containing protein [Mycobacterium sp. D16Q16]|uniref:PA14 domain-containing protein n=1 Tax=Mycobacterium sp. D16Q16 TaxID=1855659 RepID=UPI000992D9CE|nr:PA14 domain-containing protein [Mycobacterium sp. D16Q16]